jgi:hypothetical protein
VNGDGLAGIIDEELFPRPMFLPETDVDFLEPLAIEFTELAVLVSVGVLLLIFVPEELEGDAFPFPLPVDLFHCGHLAFFLGEGVMRREEHIFQSGIIQLRGKGPGQVGLLGPINVFLSGTFPNTTAFGDLSNGYVVFKL